MAITVLLAILILLGLVVLFGITFIIKGWKAAFIVTGAVFVISVVGYIAAISLIVNGMD